MAVTRIPLPAWAKTRQTDALLNLNLAETALDVRIVNGLDERGIFTVRRLLDCTPEKVLAIPGFGLKILEMIYAELEKLGFCRASRQGSQQPAQDYPLLTG